MAILFKITGIIVEVILIITRFFYKASKSILTYPYTLFHSLLFKGDQTKKKLLQKMKSAKSYDEWESYAKHFDTCIDISKWKNSTKCSSYNWKYVQKIKEQLDEALRNQDVNKMMHLLRECVSRKFGRILNPALYSHSLIGTKRLIENFQSTVLDCLNAISEADSEDLNSSEKIEFFASLKQTYGKSALFLSGGGNIAMYHYGVTRALWEKGLLPKIMSGASGGALVAALVCCKNEEELVKLYADPKTGISCEAWYRPENQWTFKQHLKFVYEKGYILNPYHLKDGLLENIGDLTFKEAYEKSGRILNISVIGYEKQSHDLLLNYLTAPNVLVWSAVWASCGVPYLLGPVELFCKDKNGRVYPYSEGEDPRKFIDGSFGQDIPFKEISQVYNVKNSIVSQTNPGITSFLQEEKTDNSIFQKIFSTILDIISAEIKVKAKYIKKMEILPQFIQRWLSLATQRYSGNVNIWPEPKIRDIMEIFDFPTPERLTRCYYGGSIRTYPKMNQIAANMLIETALEAHLIKLKEKMPLIIYTDSLKSISTQGETSESEISYSSSSENSNTKHSFVELFNKFNRVLN